MILEGKTVVVTGVGSGWAVSAPPAPSVTGPRGRRGPDRVELDGRRPSSTRRRTGGTLATDITDPESCAALVELAQERFGSVDALIQVAAYEHAWGGLYDLKLDEWREAFDTNVLGALTLMRPVATAMKAGGGGSVVLIGSQSMFKPAMPQAGYAASKSALLTAMYYLADELGPDNIRCNMVIPSWMWGPNVEMYVTGRPPPGPDRGRGPPGDRRRLPAAADDRGRRGGRRGGLLRLRPRQGRHRAVPAGELGRDAPMSAAPKRVVVWGTGSWGRW